MNLKNFPPILMPLKFKLVRLWWCVFIQHAMINLIKKIAKKRLRLLWFFWNTNSSHLVQKNFEFYDFCQRMCEIHGDLVKKKIKFYYRKLEIYWSLVCICRVLRQNECVLLQNATNLRFCGFDGSQINPTGEGRKSRWNLNYTHL